MKQVIVHLFLMSFFCVAAQDEGNFNYSSPGGNGQSLVPESSTANPTLDDDSQIVVKISGLLNVSADTYVAVFNLVQLGETTEQTNRLMKERIEKFLTALARVGVDTSLVKTELLSFVPRYDFKLSAKRFSRFYNEIPDGFEMQRSISILYRRPSLLDNIASAAAECEIYDLAKTDYFVADIGDQYNKLRLRAFELLRQRLKEYETIGFRLDTMKKVFADDFVTILPRERYASYQAFSRPAMKVASASESTGKISSREAGHFDFVINPVITEPVIQVTYSIAVKYLLKSDSKNEYLWVTPDGVTKSLLIN